MILNNQKGFEESIKALQRTAPAVTQPAQPPSRLRPSCRAGCAPASAVAELGVVRRCSHIVKTRLLLFLLLTATRAFAGYDESISARLGEWSVRADTAGTPSGMVVARIVASHVISTDIEARLEVPEVLFRTLLAHLTKLPKQRIPDGSTKRPKGDFVVFSAEHDSVLTSPTAVALLKLWLDLHRAGWQAPKYPTIQRELQTSAFPPVR